MDGMVGVGVHCGTVGELHEAAKLVALRARGEVDADADFDDAGDFGLECADLGSGALLLIFGRSGFPAEGECVNDHGFDCSGAPRW